jgi:transposase
MNPYGQELRKRVVKALRAGASLAEVSRRYEVHRHTVRDYWRRYRAKGEVFTKPKGGHRRSRLAPYREQVGRWIEEQQDLTLVELQGRLRARYGVALAVSTLGYHLSRMGLSYKKNAARQRTKPA